MSNQSIIPFLLVVLIFGVIVGYYGVGSPSITGLAGLSTSSGNLSVQVSSIIACTFSDDAFDIGFGNVDPGSAGTNATKNYAAEGGGTNYNITVDAFSTVAANITISGTDLKSGANTIPVPNVAWQSNETRNSTSMIWSSPSVKRLQTTFNEEDKIGFKVTPGETRFWRMWIDVPPLTIAGDYSGNYTIRCTSHDD